MRRISVLLSVIAVALVGLVIPGHVGHTTAQDATPDPGRHPIVGSWQVTITLVTGPMVPVPDLVTFAADGTMLNSVQPVSPAPPGAPFSLIFAGLGHGNWTATGPGAAAWTFVRLQTDENGNYLGPVTARGAAEVSADGRRVSGPFTYDVADPAGNVVASGQGTFEGTLIAVEPMGTPMAGTAAA